jgi:hypothetical protein
MGNITGHSDPASPFSMLNDERRCKRVQMQRRRVFHSDIAYSSFMISVSDDTRHDPRAGVRLGAR